MLRRAPRKRCYCTLNLALLVVALATMMVAKVAAAKPHERTFFRRLNEEADGTDDQAANAGNDDVTYWTNYAIYPKRCIVYNNQDVIVFAMYEKYTNQCSDEPIGHYITPVTSFVSGWLDWYAQEMDDQGVDDYVEPSVAQYTQCTGWNSQAGTYLYMKLGCDDYSHYKVAVNIYTDNECTKRSSYAGSDDANVDMSALEIPFKKCSACVNWVNKDEEEIDDGFYDNRQINAPLCATPWADKQECDTKCRNVGVEHPKSGWDTSDKALLAILSLFGLIMLGLIVRKRQKMSNKDALLEQAAMSAAGLQQPHVIGLLVLVVLIIAVFALLGLKNVTWVLLLVVDTVLFGYLMKLTLDSAVAAGESTIGPDGAILRRDSDDSSLDSQTREAPAETKPNQENAGTYMLPTIT